MIHLIANTILRLSDAPLAYERENRAAIDAYWTGAIAGKPRMWNGPAFLFSAVSLEAGLLRGTAHRTDFATFLHWRDTGRPPGVVHITGTSLPVTADGALFAVRMAEHTANAGAVYFPAGSFDADDLDGGVFDVTRNIGRELEEETGFDLGGGLIDDHLVAAFSQGCFHVTRRSRLPHPFADCARLLAEHQAATGDDELACAVAIRADDGSRDQLKPYARMLADWHFANPA